MKSFKNNNSYYYIIRVKHGSLFLSEAAEAEKLPSTATKTPTAPAALGVP